MPKVGCIVYLLLLGILIVVDDSQILFIAALAIPIILFVVEWGKWRIKHYQEMERMNKTSYRR